MINYGQRIGAEAPHNIVFGQFKTGFVFLLFGRGGDVAAQLFFGLDKRFVHECGVGSSGQRRKFAVILAEHGLPFENFEVMGDVQSAVVALNREAGRGAADDNVVGFGYDDDTLIGIQDVEIRVSIGVLHTDADVQTGCGNKRIADFRVERGNDVSGVGYGDEKVGLLAAVILRECLQVAVLFVGKWLFEQVDNPQQTFLTNGIIGSFFGFQAQNESLIIRYLNQLVDQRRRAGGQFVDIDVL